MPQIRFMPGDPTDGLVDVEWIGFDFARGKDGLCAFCHGDPCAERDKNTPIGRFYERNPNEQTCPMCNGRPS